MSKSKKTPESASIPDGWKEENPTVHRIGARECAAFRRFVHAGTGVTLLLLWKFEVGWWWEVRTQQRQSEEIKADCNDQWDDEPLPTPWTFRQAEAQIERWWPPKSEAA